MLRSTLPLALILCSCLACPTNLARHVLADESAAQPGGPLAPAEALKHFHLPDDLRIELVAAEPEVVDPVAIRFDELGRLWVAEMRDYPTGPTPGGKQQSRIRLLEDRDADGRYETATLFAEGRSFVTGLQPWKGGVIVTESGRVAYLKDEDGDGRADRDETWFTGFVEGNTQLRANHPRLGIDNRIYIANGLRGGSVVDHRPGGDKKPIPINGMDFRFDPSGGPAEPVSGVGQFGLAFDDWGNRFICSNRNPVRHVVIEDRYLKASPKVTVPAVAHDVAAFGEHSRVFPLTRAWTTSNLHAGQFTAACGVFIYRGDALPEAYRGNAFTCDPTGNLVHREIVKSAGPTFTSQSAYEDREWLASTDEWFRPVNMQLGPDGALYVVDMYRAVIEHPEFMPDELKQRPDLRLGDDRGRIYRVVPKDWRRPVAPPSLAKADDAQLIAALNSGNAWQRDTAQRLLLERKISGPKVGQLITSDARPEAQAMALHLNPSDDQLTRALKSPHAQVRRQAILVAESRLGQSPQLVSTLRDCLKDDDAAVRFQAMLSLTLAQQHDLPTLAASLQTADLDDPWMRSATELAAGEQAGELLDLLLAQTAAGQAAGAQSLLASLTQRAVSLNDADATKQLFGKVMALSRREGSPGTLSPVLLEALARGAKSRGLTLQALATDPADQESLQAIAASSEQIARSADADQLQRQRAIGLLAYFPDSASALAELVQQEPNQSLRQSAVAALARHSNLEVWRELIAGVGGMTPAVRRSVLEAAIGPAARASLLLDAVEAGDLKPAELDLLQANRLRQHADSKIRERARKLLAASAPTDRVEALERYQPVLKLTGDANHGRTVFEKNCSTCHRVGDVGVNVAPDISDTRTKTPAQLLADIVQPNRAIDNNYIAYNVLLADGTNTTGILTTESTTSITLKQPGDKTIVINRDDIEELRSSGVSLMPDGLEKNIEPQAMADLLAYLKNWRYLDGKTPLGK